MSHKERIQQLLRDKPGLKAQQIAAELGLERAHVATALHAFPDGEMVQDSDYRWWPRTRTTLRDSRDKPSDQANVPHPLLSRLCRYYLDCLSRESGSGISLAAAAEDVEYVSLFELPFGQRPFELQAPEVPANLRAIKRIIQKVRRERGQLTLFIGYGVRVRKVSGRDHDEIRLEPLLLYPLEDSAAEPAELLRPASGIPQFNLEILKNLPAVDSGNIIDEAIQLSEELGLANTGEDLPQWDEIIFRLQHRRPDWDWREDLNPYTLTREPRLAELSAPGIYNRTVLFAATRSPFTYGLEIELRKLAQLDEGAVRNTALGMWLRAENVESTPPEDCPILEVLALNTEQRQAVLQGLSAPLTVVTGPPGTGKSQVVTSLLVNQGWHGGSVLFSSRNNHAVDVVESRVNALAPAPLLLRLGKDEHHAQLAQSLTATLAESSSADDSTSYAWQREVHEQMRAQYAAIQQQITTVVALRNHVDELERAVEPARSLFKPDRFATLRSVDVEAIRARVATLSTALEGVREAAQPAMVRMVWDTMRSRRYQRIAGAVETLATDAASLGVAMPELESAERFHHELADKLEWAVRVQTYWRALDELRAAPPLEGLARELSRIAAESAHNSVELWRSWLRLRPGRWKPEQRKLLGEYVSLLQMIAGGDRYDEGAGRKVFHRFYTLFPK